MADASVRGVAATLRALGDFPPEIVKACEAELSNRLSPIAGQVSAAFPSNRPLSNYSEWTGRPSAFVRVTSDYSKGTPGVKARIVVPGKAPNVADMAGKKSDSAFTRNLSSKYGKASRWAWPAITGNVRAIQDAVAACVDKAVTATNYETERMP